MIKFYNLFKMASGYFNIEIFGIDLFTKSNAIALTIFNFRIAFFFSKRRNK